MRGVFPLILDVEAKAAEKVLECVWECLFSNLVAAGKETGPQHSLPWTILSKVPHKPKLPWIGQNKLVNKIRS